MRYLFKILLLLLGTNIAYAGPIITETATNRDNKMYFAIAADEQHFFLLIDLIGSIHKVNYDEVGQIAVFNLGLTSNQIAELNHIDKVYVYEVELTHPDLLTRFQVRPNGALNNVQVNGEPNKMVRGWYAWKPVVIKQALDMFPHVLYLDSGFTIKNSLHQVFQHIQQNGYFLIDSPTSIKWMATRYIIEKFNLESPEKKFILDDNNHGISAGIQGLSRKLYDSYVMPMYELSKDLNNFIDDGTTPDGFGTGRHDQPLFSMFASLLNLKAIKCFSQGSNVLMVDGKKIPFTFRTYFNFKWERDHINMKQFLRYRKN